MLKTFEAFIKKYDMLPRGCRVLIALSGGADSICLALNLLELAEPHSLKLSAAHFNHRLRPGGAERDEKFVQNFCRDRGIDCHIGRGDVAQFALEKRLGTEEAARELRYDFLYRAADETGASKIALAHNADDNAETVIYNLARGSGLRGLGGIPPVRDRIVRPLLSTGRRDILNYLEEKNQAFAHDETNDLDIYARNNIRHNVVPVLKSINPNFTQNVLNMSSLLREDEAFIEGEAQKFIDSLEDKSRAPVSDLLALPFSVGSRAVRALSGEAMSSRQTRSVYSLLSGDSPSAMLELKETVARREYDHLVFSPKGLPLEFAPVALNVPGKIRVPELNLEISCELADKCEIIHKSLTTFLFNNTKVCGNIIVRPRKQGDKIKLSGTNCTKSLKKLFIEKKIPAAKRGLIPVLADDEGVIAVYGLGIDSRVAATGNGRVLKLEFIGI
jgi:tRNA(Ile)-lysidine synthase